MNNPDNALPLYLIVVIVGIMLGSAWRSFLTDVQAASKAAGSKATAAPAVSTGSAGTTGNVGIA